MALALGRCEPALGLPLGSRRAALAVDDQATVRAGADAGILAVAPVQQIVPAFLPRPGVIGNLVALQSGLGGHRLGRGEQLIGKLGLGRAELAGLCSAANGVSGSMVSW